MSTNWTTRLRLEPIDVDRVNDLWLLHQDPGIAAYDGISSRACTTTHRSPCTRCPADEFPGCRPS